MRLRVLFAVVLFARLTSAQTPDTTRRATVSGIVRDSIARRPLAGAMVQLVAADSLARFGQTAVSDSLGLFSFAGVPNGRYTLGFFHPMLDSLGLAPTLREVYVVSQLPVSADLAIPSPVRLRVAVCGPRAAIDSAVGLLVGVVRDSRDRAPVAGVTVTGEWLEVTFKADGIVRRVPHLTVTTGENGFFAMCNVPSAGTMTLVATRGTDSTAIIDVQVPAGGFVRREMYLGAGQQARDGRLTGTVVAAIDARPVPGAQVSIVGGPQARANERGEWTLVNAPVGTRMLEVRAVGFYPDRRPVSVVAEAAPVRVALSTFKAVLDTVRVISQRYRVRDLVGFQQRQRSGVGHFMTAEDIQKKQPLLTSDLFRSVAGVRMVADQSGAERQILVRGNGSEWCVASIYLNGTHLDKMTAEDLDNWVRPQEIGGIEIYAGLGAPPQFQALTFLPAARSDSATGAGATEGMTRCGSILIWTRT